MGFVLAASQRTMSCALRGGCMINSMKEKDLRGDKDVRCER